MCHVINPCVIPSNNSLKKLLSLIGIVCQFHEKGYHTMWFVIPINFVGTQCAHTCLKFRQSWKILCALFSEIPSFQTMSFCIICLFSLVRASAWQALSSILDMLGHPGHCFLSTSLLPLLRTLYYVYTCFHDITHNPYTSTNCDEFPELQHITYKSHITLCIWTFGNVESGHAIFKLIIWWYGTLTSLCLGCMMTQTIYMCPLNGEIHCQMIYFMACSYLVFWNFFVCKNMTGSLELLHMAQDRDKWQTDVNMLINLCVPQHPRNFLASWKTISSSKNNFVPRSSSFTVPHNAEVE